MRGNGYWEIFVPGARAGDKYKYEIVGRDGRAAAAEVRPGRLRRGDAAVDRVDRRRRGQLPRPRAARRAGINALDAPMSIYEVHLGSWRRKADKATAG